MSLGLVRLEIRFASFLVFEQDGFRYPFPIARLWWITGVWDWASATLLWRFAGLASRMRILTCFVMHIITLSGSFAFQILGPTRFILTMLTLPPCPLSDSFNRRRIRSLQFLGCFDSLTQLASSLYPTRSDTSHSSPRRLSFVGCESIISRRLISLTRILSGRDSYNFVRSSTLPTRSLITDTRRLSTHRFDRLRQILLRHDSFIVYVKSYTTTFTALGSIVLRRYSGRSSEHRWRRFRHSRSCFC